MTDWTQKKWRLAVVLFVPLFLLLTLFAGLTYFFYERQVETIDEFFEQQAYQVGTDNSAGDIANIITDDDWEELSMAEIDEKLIASSSESAKLTMAPIG